MTTDSGERAAKPKRTYIAFEGPIAAGKTTLATLLAERLQCDLVLEQFSDNKFLADFYQDEARWALPMQLWFLADRHSQLQQSGPNTSKAMIADYSYNKDAIFARMLLTHRELALYEKVQCILRPPQRSPDLYVYLDATDAVLLERIKRRGRSFEAAIDDAYLKRLRASYLRDMLEDTALNCVRVDTTALDLSSDVALEELFSSILTSAGAGDA